MVILHITITELHIHIAQGDSTADNTPMPPEHIAVCEHCGWTRKYSDKKSRNRGLSAHYGHCEYLQKPKDTTELIKEVTKRRW